MALDHYVSQVHLRKFNSPAFGERRLHATRKFDLFRFAPRPRDVCRIENGSTNAYLRDERLIEEFLRTVEPAYDPSLAKLRQRKADTECIHTIAGFAAYVSSCAPAAMRLGAGPLRGSVEATAAILDRQNLIGKAPPSLGGKSLTELLAEGTVRAEIDAKYPQALGISGILNRVSVFGNSPWEILHNDDPNSPFFTSDFPVAIELRADQITNRLVPLAPDLAVRIMPDVTLSRAKPDLSFARFASRHRAVSGAEVARINRLIVQCAEEHVFYRDDQPWVAAFIAKNGGFRIDSVVTQARRGTGIMTVSRQRIVRITKRAA